MPKEALVSIISRRTVEYIAVVWSEGDIDDAITEHPRRRREERINALPQRRGKSRRTQQRRMDDLASISQPIDFLVFEWEGEHHLIDQRTQMRRYFPSREAAEMFAIHNA